MEENIKQSTAAFEEKEDQKESDPNKCKCANKCDDCTCSSQEDDHNNKQEENKNQEEVTTTSEPKTYRDYLINRFLSKR